MRTQKQIRDKVRNSKNFPELERTDQKSLGTVANIY